MHLRQYLSNQPAPSTTDQITLPPPFVSLILPHINARRAGHAFGAGASSSAATSSSVTTAVLQRAKLLQDENDELYELLKHCEVSRLNEEVRGLRRVVQKLEDALKGEAAPTTSCIVKLTVRSLRVSQGDLHSLVRSYIRLVGLRLKPDP